MEKYSFIDEGTKDFLRDDSGEVIVIEGEDFHDAESWLLNHGEDYGWTNTGVRFHVWGED